MGDSLDGILMAPPASIRLPVGRATRTRQLNEWSRTSAAAGWASSRPACASVRGASLADLLRAYHSLYRE